MRLDPSRNAPRPDRLRQPTLPIVVKVQRPVSGLGGSSTWMISDRSRHYTLTLQDADVPAPLRALVGHHVQAFAWASIVPPGRIVLLLEYGNAPWQDW